MERNILILYWLAFLKNAWLWLAIWSLFYLLYTDYAGIGVIETVTFFIVFLMEIPSGALADKYGKKKIILAALFLLALGNVLMGVAPDYWFLLGAVSLVAIGYAFSSGSFEALTYDTLQTLGREDEFERIIARQSSIQLFTFAGVAVIGGFFYTIEPGLPFILTGCLLFIGFITSLFLVEPASEEEEQRSFIAQNKEGFKTAFRKGELLPYSLLFLLIGSVPLFMYEFGAELTLVEKGATATEMSFFIPIILLSAALFAWLAPRITKVLGKVPMYFCIGFLYACSLFFIPTLGLWAIFILNICWASSSAIRHNIESVIINSMIASNVRATTLSTLSMLKFLPYAATAVFLGALADQITMSLVVFYLGVLMLVLVGLAAIQFVLQRQTTVSK